MTNAFRFCALLFLIVLCSFGKDSNLNAQELIVFERGLFPEFYEDDRKISRQEFLSKINSIPESSVLWKKYKTNAAIGAVGSIGSLGGLVWWLGKEDGESTTAPIITTFATMIVGSIFTGKAFKNKRDAVLTYNKDATVGSFITPSNKGIGLTLHF